MIKSNSKLRNLYIILVIVFLYIPFIPLILFSFNDSKSLTEFSGFSFQWYQKMWEDKDIATAVINTVSCAVIATLISTFIGTIAAIALSRPGRKWFKKIILKINQFPIVNPDIVTAVAMLLLFVSFKIPTGYGTMLLAHIAFCTPYVVVTVYPKVRGLDANIIEAAEDLGATPWQAIMKVVVPQLKDAVIAAAAIAFTMSFDDFIISYFTSGGIKNISIYLYTTKRRDPSINAFSTIITLIITAIVIVNFVRSSKKEKAPVEQLKSRRDSSSAKKHRIVIASICSFVLLVCVGGVAIIRNSSAEQETNVGMFKVVRCMGKETLNVFNWGSYIDTDTLESFEKEYNVCVAYSTFDSNESAIEKLKKGEVYDVIVPSEYAIEELVAADLVEEIDWSRIKNISPSLDTTIEGENDMTMEVKRIISDLKESKDGWDFLKYAVPFFWGSLGYVYDTTTVDESELEELQWDIFKSNKYKIAHYDTSRDAFVAPLKQLGYSMNTINEVEIDQAVNWLIDEKEKVGKNHLSYVGDDVIEDMAASNNRYDIAMVYSGDAVYQMMENEKLGFYKPSVGTNVWLDGMIIQKGAENIDLAYEFINYMTLNESAKANSLFVGYSSTKACVYKELLETDMADYKDAYEVIYNRDVDEVFRYNDTNKTLLNDAWASVKLHSW